MTNTGLFTVPLSDEKKYSGKLHPVKRTLVFVSSTRELIHNTKTCFCSIAIFRLTYSALPSGVGVRANQSLCYVCCCKMPILSIHIWFDLLYSVPGMSKGQLYYIVQHSCIVRPCHVSERCILSATHQLLCWLSINSLFSSSLEGHLDQVCSVSRARTSKFKDFFLRDQLFGIKALLCVSSGFSRTT